MKFKYLIFIFTVFLFISCGNETHFLENKTYRKTILNDFEEVKQLASNRSDKLFNILEDDISLKEKEALMFLYAYMPLSDLADYDGKFFLKQVQLAFKTRRNMPWGASIPNDIFRHYVLPPRVNNENMDTSRILFYNELKDRLIGLTLKEAALEVNHWCHEKVIYQPTSQRTISPLGAIKSAYGRCGEESTFAVSALRAAGIPARQCYTPRWAHCDDNHAWVEVWIDDKWYYMGACEPEPKLNKAWFDEPVLRAMLVHSKSIGKYKGNEIVDTQKDKFAYMNLIGNYVSTKELFVKVVDVNNNPVSDAKVEFQLYNYAEFYPLSTQTTKNSGLCSFTTGYGDLLIWAYKDDSYNYKKVTIETTDTLTILVDKNPTIPNTELFTMIPPIKRKSKMIVSDTEKEINNKLLKLEDSIRNSYVATFMDETDTFILAENLNINKKKVWDYIKKSRGNWPNIVDYLEKGVEINKELSIKQLELISDKDLRDVESHILIGNLKASSELFRNVENTNLFNDCIFKPREAHEKLTDSKNYLRDKFRKLSISNAENLINWIKQEITVDNDWNYYKVPITPQGIFEIRISDTFSRNLFFVLGCRTLGIPARFEPATNIPQYYTENEWNDAIFEESQQLIRIKGNLELSKEKNIGFDPQYRIHFSLAKFENGRYNTLGYGWNKPLSELGKTLPLDIGTYMLLTGNRQPDGSVLTKMDFFEIKEDETTKIEIGLNKLQERTKPLAFFEQTISFENKSNEIVTLNKKNTNVIIWLDPKSEPSKHVLNDIKNLTTELSESSINFHFITDGSNNQPETLIESYNLPSKSQTFIDKNWEQLNTFSSETKLSKNELPVVILMKGKKVVYHNSGYTIGVGEQLLKLH